MPHGSCIEGNNPFILNRGREITHMSLLRNNLVNLLVTVALKGTTAVPLHDDFEDLDSTVEKLDNIHKNNIKITGMKEGLEGKDLSVYLVELFLQYGQVQIAK